MLQHTETSGDAALPVGLTLISHVLCPYVQRAVIALTEKQVAFERIDIELANKPAWFLAASPLGKTPVLLVGQTAVFEGAVILEYLEETQAYPLHPDDPLKRAEHRAWMEFGSATLNDIAGLYGAADEASFAARVRSLSEKFDHVERRLTDGPFFDGDKFCLVDAVFAPIFRYFDVFDQIDDFGILSGKPKTDRWRAALAGRPSVKEAVVADYNQRLRQFLTAKQSHLSRLMAGG